MQQDSQQIFQQLLASNGNSSQPLVKAGRFTKGQDIYASIESYYLAEPDSEIQTPLQVEGKEIIFKQINPITRGTIFDENNEDPATFNDRFEEGKNDLMGSIYQWMQVLPDNFKQCTLTSFIGVENFIQAFLVADFTLDITTFQLSISSCEIFYNEEHSVKVNQYLDQQQLFSSYIDQSLVRRTVLKKGESSLYTIFSRILKVELTVDTIFSLSLQVAIPLEVLNAFETQLKGQIPDLYQPYTITQIMEFWKLVAESFSSVGMLQILDERLHFYGFPGENDTISFGKYNRFSNTSEFEQILNKFKTFTAPVQVHNIFLFIQLASETAFIQINLKVGNKKKEVGFIKVIMLDQISKVEYVNQILDTLKTNTWTVGQNLEKDFEFKNCDPIQISVYIADYVLTQFMHQPYQFRNSTLQAIQSQRQAHMQLLTGYTNVSDEVEAPVLDLPFKQLYDLLESDQQLIFQSKVTTQTIAQLDQQIMAEQKPQTELVEFLEFLKFPMEQVRIDDNYTFFQYFFYETSVINIRPEKVQELKQGLTVLLINIEKAKIEKVIAQQTKFNKEIPLEIYNIFNDNIISNKDSDFLYARLKKGTVNEDWFVCKPHTIFKGLPLEDLVYTLIQNIKQDFTLNEYSSFDAKDYDIKAKACTLTGEQQIIDFLNNSYNVDIKYGVKQSKGLNYLQVWPVTYTPFVDSPQRTSLVNFDRIYPNPTEAVKFLHNKMLQTRVYQKMIAQVFTVLKPEQITTFITDLSALEKIEDLRTFTGKVYLCINKYISYESFTDSIIIDKLVSYQDKLFYRDHQNLVATLKTFIKDIYKQQLQAFKDNQKLKEQKVMNDLKMLEQYSALLKKQVDAEIVTLTAKAKALEEQQKLINAQAAQKAQQTQAEKDLVAKSQAELNKVTDELNYKQQSAKWQEFISRIPASIGPVSYDYESRPFKVSGTNDDVLTMAQLDQWLTQHNVIATVMGSSNDVDTIRRFLQRNISTYQTNWKELFSAFTTVWIQTTSKSNFTYEAGANGQILTVTAASISLKQVINNNLRYFQDPNGYQELRFIASYNIMVDTDLVDTSNFRISGKNISLAANKIIVLGQYNINTSTIELLPNPLRPYDPNSLDGINGLAGKSAGNVYIQSGQPIENLGWLSIFANGANGENGGDGKPGANGTNGANGIDGRNLRNFIGDVENELDRITNKTNNTSTQYVLVRGTKGVVGEKGKNGGNAGIGGKGGFEGQVLIKQKDSTLNNQSYLRAFQSNKGYDGISSQSPGKGGAAGSNGINGKDVLWWKEVSSTRIDYHEVYGWDMNETDIQKSNKEFYILFRGDFPLFTYKGNNSPTYAGGYGKSTGEGQQGNKGIGNQSNPTQVSQINSSLIQKTQQVQQISQTIQSTVINQSEISQLQQQQQQLSQKLSDSVKLSEKSSAELSALQQTQQTQQQQQSELQSSKQQLEQQLKANEQKQVDAQQKSSAIQQENAILLQQLQTLEQKLSEQTQQMQQNAVKIMIATKYEGKIKGVEEEYYFWNLGPQIEEEITLPQNIINFFNDQFLPLCQYLDTQKFAQQTLVEYIMDLIESLTTLARANIQKDYISLQVKNIYKKLIKQAMINIPTLGLAQSYTTLTTLLNKMFNKVKVYDKNLPLQTYSILKQLLETSAFNNEEKAKFTDYFMQYDQIVELLLEISTYLPQNDAIYLLKSSIMIDSKNAPKNALSQIIHETQKQMLIKGKTQEEFNLAKRITNKINDRITLLERNLTKSVLYEEDKLIPIEINQCTLYNHYFSGYYRVASYPLDDKILKFNEEQNAQSLIPVIREIHNIFKLTLQQNFCLSQIQSTNLKCLLTVIEFNINRLPWNYYQAIELQGLCFQIQNTIKDKQNFFFEAEVYIYAITQNVNKLIIKCQSSQILFNYFVNMIQVDFVSKNIMEKIKQCFSTLEQSNLTLAQKRPYYTQFLQLLDKLNNQMNQELLYEVDEMLSNIKRIQLTNQQEYKKDQLWTQVKLSIIKIFKNAVRRRIVGDSEGTQELYIGEMISLNFENFKKGITANMMSNLQVTNTRKLEETIESFYFTYNQLKQDQDLQEVNIAFRQDLIYQIEDGKAMNNVQYKINDMIEIVDLWYQIVLSNIQRTKDYKSIQILSLCIPGCENHKFDLEILKLVKEVNYQKLEEYLQVILSKQESIDPSLQQELYLLKSLILSGLKLLNQVKALDKIQKSFLPKNLTTNEVEIINQFLENGFQQYQYFTTIKPQQSAIEIYELYNAAFQIFSKEQSIEKASLLLIIRIAQIRTPIQNYDEFIKSDINEHAIVMLQQDEKLAEFVASNDLISLIDYDLLWNEIYLQQQNQFNKQTFANLIEFIKEIFLTKRFANVRGTITQTLEQDQAFLISKMQTDQVLTYEFENYLNSTATLERMMDIFDIQLTPKTDLKTLFQDFFSKGDASQSQTVSIYSVQDLPQQKLDKLIKYFDKILKSMSFIKILPNDNTYNNDEFVKYNTALDKVLNGESVKISLKNEIINGPIKILESYNQIQNPSLYNEQYMNELINSYLIQAGQHVEKLDIIDYANLMQQILQKSKTNNFKFKDLYYQVYDLLQTKIKVYFTKSKLNYFNYTNTITTLTKDIFTLIKNYCNLNKQMDFMSITLNLMNQNLQTYQLVLQSPNGFPQYIVNLENIKSQIKETIEKPGVTDFKTTMEKIENIIIEIGSIIVAGKATIQKRSYLSDEINALIDKYNSNNNSAKGSISFLFDITSKFSEVLSKMTLEEKRNSVESHKGIMEDLINALYYFPKKKYDKDNVNFISALDIIKKQFNYIKPETQIETTKNLLYKLQEQLQTIAFNDYSQTTATKLSKTFLVEQYNGRCDEIQGLVLENIEAQISQSDSIEQAQTVINYLLKVSNWILDIQDFINEEKLFALDISAIEESIIQKLHKNNLTLDLEKSLIKDINTTNINEVRINAVLLFQELSNLNESLKSSLKFILQQIEDLSLIHINEQDQVTQMKEFILNILDSIEQIWKEAIPLSQQQSKITERLKPLIIKILEDHRLGSTIYQTAKQFYETELFNFESYTITQQVIILKKVRGIILYYEDATDLEFKLFLNDHFLTTTLKYPKAIFDVLLSTLLQDLPKVKLSTYIQNFDIYFEKLEREKERSIANFKIDAFAKFDILSSLFTSQEEVLFNIIKMVKKIDTSDVNALKQLLINNSYPQWDLLVQQMAFKYIAVMLIEISNRSELNQNQVIDENAETVLSIIAILNREFEYSQKMSLANFNDILTIVTTKLQFTSEKVQIKDVIEIIQLLHLIAEDQTISDLLVKQSPSDWMSYLLYQGILSSLQTFINEKNSHTSMKEWQSIGFYQKSLKSLSKNKDLLLVFHKILLPEVENIEGGLGSLQNTTDLMNMLDGLVYISQNMDKQIDLAQYYFNSISVEPILTTEEDKINYQKYYTEYKQELDRLENLKKVLLQRMKKLQFTELKFEIQKQQLSLRLFLDLNLEEHQLLVSNLITLEKTEVHELFLQILERLQKYDVKILRKLVQQIINKKIVLNKGSIDLIKAAELFQWEAILINSQKSVGAVAYNVIEMNEQILTDSYNNKQQRVLEWTQQQVGPAKTDTKLITILDKIKKEAKRIYDEFIIATKGKNAADALVIATQKCKDWAIANKGKVDKLQMGNIHEILGMLSFGVEIILNYGAGSSRVNILACLLFYADAYEDKSGMISQVPTGEGKTSLVAQWAIIQSIFYLNPVDVITSSSVLVTKDMDEMKILYEAFNVKVANNCDQKANDDEIERRNRYKADVIYGDVGSFQRDYLLDSKCFDQNIKGGRVAGCIIVDEVDSMLLDKAENSLYLSHEIPDLEYLQPLYIQIWACVNSPDCLNGDEITVDNIQKLIQLNIKNDNLKIPEYLKDFIFQKLQSLIQNAYRAINMEENDPYIIEGNKENRIVVMDKATGVEQLTTQWSEGLHQFLQLKHQDNLTSESLKAVFISNLAYFKQFRGRKFFGMTGTIGSDKEKEYLNKQFNVEFLNIPRYQQREFYYYTPLIGKDQNEWLLMLKDIIVNDPVKKPMLLICENIQTVNFLFDQINKYKETQDKAVNVFKYTKSDARPEDAICTSKSTIDGKVVISEKITLFPQDVLLATNIAGRGQNIQILKGKREATKDFAYSKDVKDPLTKVGLHVLITYMPDNIRVEDQAFGRSARGGDKGTGQFCIINDKFTTIEPIKRERDLIEEQRIFDLSQTQIQRLEAEDSLFIEFQRIYEIALKAIDNLNEGDLYKKVQKTALMNRWALFLEKIQPDLNMVYKNGRSGIDKLFYEFSQNCLAAVSSSSLLKMADTISDKIKLGHYYSGLLEDATPANSSDKDKKLSDEQKKTKYMSARECYQSTIDEEPLFSEVAVYYKMFAEHQIQNYGINGEDKSNLKSVQLKRKEFINLLKQSELLINLRVGEMSANVQVCEQVEELQRKGGKGLYENVFKLQQADLIAAYGVHIQQLQAVKGSYIDSQVIQELFTGIADKDNAKKVYRFLKKNYKIFRLEKISTNVTINKENQLVANTKQKENMKYTQRKVGSIVQFPPHLQYCENKVVALLNSKITQAKDLSLTFDTFNNILLTKDQFWKILTDENLFLNQKKTYLITFNNQEIYKFLDLDKIKKYSSAIQDYLKLNQNTEITEDTLRSKFESTGVVIKDLIQNLTTAKLLKPIVKGTIKLNQANITDIDDKLPQFVIQNKYSSLLLQFLTEDDILKDQVEINKGELILCDNFEEAVDSLFNFLIKENVAKQCRFLFEEFGSFGLRQDCLENIENELNRLQQDMIKITDSNHKDFSIKEILKQMNLQQVHKVFDSTGTKLGALLMPDLKQKIGMLKWADDIEITFDQIDFCLGADKSNRSIKSLTEKMFDKVMKFESVMEWRWNWNAFAVFMIGLAQLIAGACLTVLTVGMGIQIGNALIAEGVSDMITGVKALISNEFSWKEWGISKAISIGVSILTLGVGAALSSAQRAGQVAAGSLGKEIAKNVAKSTTEIIKAIAKASLEEALKGAISEGINYGIEKAMTAMMEEFNEKFINKLIEGSIQQTFDNATNADKQSLTNSLYALYKSSFDKTTVDNFIILESENQIAQFGETFDTVFRYVSGAVKGIAKGISAAAEGKGSSQNKWKWISRALTPLLDSIKLGTEIGVVKLRIEQFFKDFQLAIDNQTKLYQPNTLKDKPNVVFTEKELKELYDILKTKITKKLEQRLATQVTTFMQSAVSSALESTIADATESLFKLGSNKLNAIKEVNKNKAKAYQEHNNDAEVANSIAASQEVYLKKEIIRIDNEISKTTSQTKPKIDNVDLNVWLKSENGMDKQLIWKNNDSEIDVVKSSKYMMQAFEMQNTETVKTPVQMQAVATSLNVKILITKSDGTILPPIEPIQPPSTTNTNKAVKVSDPTIVKIIESEDANGKKIYLPDIGLPPTLKAVSEQGEDYFVSAILFERDSSDIQGTKQTKAFEELYKSSTKTNKVLLEAAVYLHGSDALKKEFSNTGSQPQGSQASKSANSTTVTTALVSKPTVPNNLGTSQQQSSKKINSIINASKNNATGAPVQNVVVPPAISTTATKKVATTNKQISPNANMSSQAKISKRLALLKKGNSIP